MGKARGLVQYQEEFPFYFKMVLDKINIDFESRDYLPGEKEFYVLDLCTGTATNALKIVKSKPEVL